MEKICKNGHKYKDDGKQSTFCPPCRSALGKRNKRKGSANESRFAKMLQEMFNKYDLPYTVRRTPRSGGIREFESSDIMFSRVHENSVLSQIHFELKDTQHFYIEDWIKEALIKESDSGKNRNPVIIARKPNSSNEYAIMNVDFFVNLLMVIEKFIRDDK